MTNGINKMKNGDIFGAPLTKDFQKTSILTAEQIDVLCNLVEQEFPEIDAISFGRNVAKNIRDAKFEIDIIEISKSFDSSHRLKKNDEKEIYSIKIYTTVGNCIRKLLNILLNQKKSNQ